MRPDSLTRATALLACLAVACAPRARRGRDDSDDGADAGSETSCAAGATIACTCSDGSTGTAACVADGSRYGECACGPAGGCTPGSTESCTCASVPGTKSCLPDGSGWDSCSCPATSCQPTALSPVGSVSYPGGSVVFTGGTVEATFGHRRTTDESGGCIAKAGLLVAKGACVLSLSYGAVSGAFGGLEHAVFHSDGSCGPAGTWQSAPGYGPTWFTGAATIPDPTAAASCANASLSFTDDVLPLFDANGDELDLTLGGLVLAGNLTSAGDSELVCVDAACGGAYHDAGGWCVTGACGPGDHDGGDGTCVANGQCSPGYAIGADGACTLAPTCQAIASAPVDATVGIPVTLDGSSSTAPGNISYRWTLAGPTSASQATITNPTSAVASFVPDVPGVYVATLSITAGGCASSAQATIDVANAAPTGHKLEVVLTWADATTGTAGGDLDLHLRGPASVTPSYPSVFFESQADCYYGTCAASFGAGALDWGFQNTVAPDQVVTNNPTLDQDSFWGGPESISIPSAFDGQFVAGVNYYCRLDVSGANAGSTGALAATVVVKLDGVLKGQQTATLPSEGTMWEAAVVTVYDGGTEVAVAPSTTPMAPWADSGGNCGE